jgi:tRNA A37 threonylcarbamoyladenosine synthetase subunit TsaC/SUA5/YrdC
MPEPPKAPAFFCPDLPPIPQADHGQATARIYRGTPRNLALLARRLRGGGLVAVPTETVYGLAGDATSRAACLRIFSAKGRPASDP